jgi:RimJ/RimL family protein N-acetyltransferase
MNNTEPRINLSLIKEEDIDFIVDIKTNAFLWSYETDISTDKEAIRKTVLKRMEGNWYKQYLIQLNNDQKTSIGELHIHWYVEERKSWEMGYCILPEYRGYGYCTEATKIILSYAFNEWDAHKVIGMCNEFNVQSQKVMEKVGMVKEGIFREELPCEGKWVNQYFYCILEHEYNKQYSK